MGRVRHSTRILRSPHPIKLGNLLDSRIKIGRINSIELKFDLTITLIFYDAKHCKLDFNNSVYIKIIKIKKIEYYLFAKISNFDAKKIKLFKIIRKIKDLTYKLKMLSHIKIHNIILIKHLK